MQKTMSNSKEILLRKATADDALFISRGFHTAMLYDDADDSRISTFAELICTRTDVLYSWRNTTIAEIDGEPVGMITAYDGARYHDMRMTTMELVRSHLGIEFPGMEDEAVPGEYYLDSLAVVPQHRNKGVGRMLLQHGIAQGLTLGLKVTLAVDPVNTKAKQLYNSLGFTEDGTLFIFGHDYIKMVMSPTSI